MQTSILPKQLHNYRKIAICLLMLFAAAMTSLTGCGKKRELAPLSGKVLYKGQPLRFGTVVFEHEYGQPATGAIQPDGTFTLTTRGEGEGTAVSTSRVRVACYEGQNPSSQAAAGEVATLGRSLIPEKYTSFETSGLSVRVRSGANDPVILELE
ncbi:MAG: hypothetical protein JXM70_26400 [Pirellulales bacterium]|nr:hypothetical protein [Pirellulales bacterium]